MRAYKVRAGKGVDFAKGLNLQSRVCYAGNNLSSFDKSGPIPFVCEYKFGFGGISLLELFGWPGILPAELTCCWPRSEEVLSCLIVSAVLRRDYIYTQWGPGGHLLPK